MRRSRLAASACYLVAGRAGEDAGDGSLANLQIVATSIPGVVAIEPAVFSDGRGFFMELFNADRYRAVGIRAPLVQDNLSRSTRGVLRGLHLQNPHPQGKLVTALRGTVLDVAVDVRLGSPSFGQHVKMELSEESRRQLWVPRGFAHGFVAVSEVAEFFYKCDELYSPADELVLRFDDPDLSIDWGISAPIVSERDRNGSLLSELKDRLPVYAGP
jgi:dTDP-4-dehydrorhamnose 3,5-epimerase